MNLANESSRATCIGIAVATLSCVPRNPLLLTGACRDDHQLMKRLLCDRFGANRQATEKATKRHS